MNENAAFVNTSHGHKRHFTSFLLTDAEAICSPYGVACSTTMPLRGTGWMYPKIGSNVQLTAKYSVLRIILAYKSNGVTNKNWFYHCYYE
jgi:hypothetical protein